ncbi:hypothetical protein LUZ63_016312 [Rhynchospora breviuscula]|uniref:Uncharacterized protein n=1 Tax=Rhynchospora breviuscula TaxID=2022672 RepID=A0A9P9Z9P2_9POAL|nr:hypothetical protein LUZ63_016312 [Rhynchospora breviuscula]
MVTSAHPPPIKTAGPTCQLRTTATARPWNLRSKNGFVAKTTSNRKDRPRFSVALSPDEIAEDIYAVTGFRPRRRPKKRPRLVQKHIENVFPGSLLTEITLELYRVP